MLFCRKTDETVWKPPLSKRTLPISEQFFHDPPLCPNFKTQNPPPAPPNFRRTHYGFNCVKSVQQVTAT